jgi:hypothetical protein
MNQFPTIKTGRVFKVAFTVWVLGALAALAVSGELVYVVIHFIKKFW